jgi:proline-specific peptidase
MKQTKEREGLLDVPGGRVWYRIEGGGAGVPLLLLHGGPGGGHDYLEPLAVLSDERPVVFYDQLGCGKSDIPDDTSLWRIDRFVAEVDAVRKGLGLERIHLLGQSWGGFLAIEYMVGKPAGIVSLTLASTAPSSRSFIEGVLGLVQQLPEDVRKTIERCETEGTTDSPEYLAACMVFYQKHLCRMQPWPEPAMRSMANVFASPVYPFMWGPSEFACTGNLKDWDRQDRIAEIQSPTLITTGRYDEMVVPIAEVMHASIPNSELRIFEDSSHSAHAEEPELYAKVLRDFFRRTEAAA